MATTSDMKVSVISISQKVIGTKILPTLIPEGLLSLMMNVAENNVEVFSLSQVEGPSKFHFWTL